MKRPTWKEEQRALNARAEAARRGTVEWDSLRQGTYNEGKNAKKREKRALARADRAWLVADACGERAPKVKRLSTLGF